MTLNDTKRIEHHIRMFVTRAQTLVAEVLAHVGDRFRLKNTSLMHLSTALGGMLSLTAVANKVRSSARNEVFVVFLRTLPERMVPDNDCRLACTTWAVVDGPSVLPGYASVKH